MLGLMYGGRERVELGKTLESDWTLPAKIGHCPPKSAMRPTNLATNHLNRIVLAHPQLIDHLFMGYETLVSVQAHHELIQMHLFG